MLHQSTAPEDIAVEGDIAHITLRDRRGGVAGVTTIDASDLARALAIGRWYIAGRRYRYAMHGGTLLLHRFLLNAPAHLYVDHENGNGLDNRRDNLRLCTNRLNQGNRHVPASGTSRFRGVYLYSRARKSPRWYARIRRDGCLYHLGSFPNEEDAARAYDRAAREHFGVFARLNFPEDGR